MKSSDIPERARARLAVLALIIFCGLALITVWLWRMQVGRSSYYQSSLETQSVRRVQMPGIRGSIFDRNGTCLAGNKPNYCIAIYLEEIKRAGRRGRTADQAWKLLQQIGAVIGREPETDLKQIERHLASRRPLPLIAWENLDDESVARFSESALKMPAVELMVKPARNYPFGITACHALGYVASIQRKEGEKPHHYYLPDLAGKCGIEKYYDSDLSGRPGGELVRIDVSGFKHETISRREPEFGKDLLLAIDLKIQRAAEEIIGDTVGAAVVIDPNNGDVLALASAPGFNLQEFQPVLYHSTWNRLISDERVPLLSRGPAGLYAPGSVFKPVVAIAALSSGGFDTELTYPCAGFTEVGGSRFSCFKQTPHGIVGFREALELSCNVFFYRLGMECGYDQIYKTALELGFGQKTGIDLDYEAAGLLPSREWHYRNMGRPWLAGDTCNISIGQGSLMATPLQMAVVVAAIANGGKVFEPRLVIARREHGETAFQRLPVRLRKAIDWEPEHLALVKDGMMAVIQERRGTGHAAAVPGVVMAGKTGTAEYGAKGEDRQRGWMLVFAPFDNPRYAAVMVVEDAATGGTTVGPRMGRLMAEIFELERGPEESS